MRHLKTFEDKISLTKESDKPKNYMFFKNIQNIKRMADEILMMDPEEVDSVLNDANWAADHISTSKDDIEEVYNFLWSK